MSDPRPAVQNDLLASLLPEEADRVFPRLERVELPVGTVLYESGTSLSHVYFPCTCIISLLYVLADGASAGMAIVGHEGLVGIALFMGGETTPNRAVVQAAGYAFRLPASVVKDEFHRGGAMQHLLLRYTQALLTQMSQTAVCNRHHSLEQQLCRWLLLCMDRLPANELVTTHELIAGTLGVRREGVTQAVGNLQRDGLIQHRRGHIVVLDRAGLEARCCECYEVVRTEFARLLPRPVPR